MRKTNEINSVFGNLRASQAAPLKELKVRALNTAKGQIGKIFKIFKAKPVRVHVAIGCSGTEGTFKIFLFIPITTKNIILSFSRPAALARGACDMAPCGQPWFAGVASEHSATSCRPIRCAVACHTVHF